MVGEAERLHCHDMVEGSECLIYDNVPVSAL